MFSVYLEKLPLLYEVKRDKYTLKFDLVIPIAALFVKLDFDNCVTKYVKEWNNTKFERHMEKKWSFNLDNEFKYDHMLKCPCHKTYQETCHISTEFLSINMDKLNDNDRCRKADAPLNGRFEIADIGNQMVIGKIYCNGGYELENTTSSSISCSFLDDWPTDSDNHYRQFRCIKKSEYEETTERLEIPGKSPLGEVKMNVPSNVSGNGNSPLEEKETLEAKVSTLKYIIGGLVGLTALLALSTGFIINRLRVKNRFSLEQSGNVSNTAHLTGSNLDRHYESAYYCRYSRQEFQEAENPTYEPVVQEIGDEFNDPAYARVDLDGLVY